MAPPPPQPQPPPSDSTSSQTGIDIRDALSILSARAEKGNDHDHEITDALKEMGQKIDITATDDPVEFTKLSTNDSDDHDCCSNNNCASDGSLQNLPNNDNDDGEEKKHEAMTRERERRGEEIRTQLQSMGVVDLLGMIFQAQQERVATFKHFEKGFSTVLASGNMTDYPTLCAKVTASFSVLSDTVNSVKSSLDERHKRRDVTHFIAELQTSEGEKLRLTAALQLERLRSRNAQLERSALPASEAEDRTVTLLKDGICSLERSISGVVETINEVLDELRCIAADENSE